jgi:hypothetical protein
MSEYEDWNWIRIEDGLPEHLIEDHLPEEFLIIIHDEEELNDIY